MPCIYPPDIAVPPGIERHARNDRYAQSEFYVRLYYVGIDGIEYQVRAELACRECPMDLGVPDEFLVIGDDRILNECFQR